MEFALTVLPNELRQSVQATLEVVRLAEQAGFSEAWIGDSQGLWKDAYVCLGACALRTSRIKLGIGVTNVGTRHLAVTARAIATVDELSGGRAMLGLGAGYTSHQHLGWKPAPVMVCREAVQALGKLLQGEAASWQGATISPLLNLGCGKVPIYLAANGPRMLEMGGEVADCVIGSVGVTAEHVRYLQHHIGLGMSRRNDGKGGLALQAGGVIADDDEQAALEARTYVAYKIITPVPLEVSKFQEEDFQAMKGRYSYQEHLSHDASHTADYPAEMVRRFALAGVPATVLEQLRGLRALGVQKVFVQPVGKDTRKLIEAFATEIIPVMAATVEAEGG